jgi:hypothetical protein
VLKSEEKRMKTLADSIRIKATPEKIFNTLLDFFSTEENYKMWHKDHVSCKWIKGNPFEKGSILYAEEYLHGELHKMKFLCTNLIINNKFEYRVLFPASIICPGGNFLIQQDERHCIFTANLFLRFGNFFYKYAKDRIGILEKHMKEEAENLKKIVENGI